MSQSFPPSRSPAGWLVTSRPKVSPTLRVLDASPRENMLPACAGQSQQRARPGLQITEVSHCPGISHSTPPHRPLRRMLLVVVTHRCGDSGAVIWNLSRSPGPLFTCIRPSHVSALRPTGLGQGSLHGPLTRTPPAQTLPLALGTTPPPDGRCLASSRFQKLVGEGRLVLVRGPASSLPWALCQLCHLPWV